MSLVPTYVYMHVSVLESQEFPFGWVGMFETCHTPYTDASLAWMARYTYCRQVGVIAMQSLGETIIVLRKMNGSFRRTL